MATLSGSELVEIRQALSRGETVTWSKAQVNAAAQAIEDRLQSSKAVLNADIEAAAPGAFDPQQKLKILAWVTLRFAKSEGGI